MKICIFGVAPWVQTGYGKTTKLLCEGLVQAGHDVIVASYFGHTGAALTYAGATVYPLYGYLHNKIVDGLKTLVEATRPDVVLQHFDVWTLRPDWAKNLPCKVVTYSPIDSYPMPEIAVQCHEGVHTAVAMSPFASIQMAEAKLTKRTGAHVHYIPHMFDDTIYKPKRARFTHLAEDAVCFGFVGTNRGIRKGLPQLLQAFKYHNHNFPRDVLFLHTHVLQDETNHDGVDIAGMIHKLGLQNNVFATPTEQYLMGLAEDDMAKIYNHIDYLVHPAMAEGFCIPIVEAQACGTPCIVSEWSATPYTEGTASTPKIQESAQIYMSVIDAWHYAPDINSIVEALKSGHEARFTPKYDRMVQDAQENARKYTKDTVMQMWLDLLENLA